MTSPSNAEAALPRHGTPDAQAGEDSCSPNIAGQIERKPSALGVWRMSLVVSASALCGGIAVVLWNRRLLARMREPSRVVAEQTSFWEDDH